MNILWGEIRQKKALRKLDTEEIKKFFGIKKDGVYKALK